jgi:hypothetical protein
MPWFKDSSSLAREIYDIYIETIKIFLQPQVSDLFNDGRKTARTALLNKLISALNKVYNLERKSQQDQSFDYENPP